MGPVCSMGKTKNPETIYTVLVLTLGKYRWKRCSEMENAGVEGIGTLNAPMPYRGVREWQCRPLPFGWLGELLLVMNECVLAAFSPCEEQFFTHIQQAIWYGLLGAMRRLLQQWGLTLHQYADFHCHLIVLSHVFECLWDRSLSPGLCMFSSYVIMRAILHFLLKKKLLFLISHML